MLPQEVMQDTVLSAPAAVDSIRLLLQLNVDTVAVAANCDSSTPLGFWEIVRDLVLTLSPLLGLFIGYRGLVTWWDQLRGKADFELARRILEKTYQVRDVVNRIRNPFGFTKPEDLEKPRHERLQESFSARWRELSDPMSELEAAAIQAEALWGSDFSNAIRPLRRKIFDLNFAIEQYLDSQHPAKREDFDRDEKRKWRRIVYRLGEEKDTFNKELEDVIANIEERVRPHIERKAYGLFSTRNREKKS